MRSARERVRGAALVAFSVLAALGLGGCASDVIDPDGPWEALEERPCPEDSPLDWETFGDPFVRSWCTGCHSDRLGEDLRRGAPMDVNFNTHEDVVAHLEAIWIRAGDTNRTMPPAGGPGAAERALLGEWLACGAP